VTSESQGRSGLPAISKAVKRFRLACDQTQVEFAIALGIAPTSIHRYEAGTSIPDFPVLKKLLDYAVKRGDSGAQETFMRELGTRMGLDPQAIENPSGGTDALSAVHLEGERLSKDEKARVVALVLLLRHSADSTNRSVIEAVLQPWMSKARETLKR
jgi:transcriptional regulator with XRE-family HTH domain